MLQSDYQRVATERDSFEQAWKQSEAHIKGLTTQVQSLTRQNAALSEELDQQKQRANELAIALQQEELVVDTIIAV